MSELPKDIKKTGNQIIKDLFKLLPEKQKIIEFSRKKYISKRMHKNLMRGTYFIAGLAMYTYFGNANSVELVKVIDKGFLKVLIYKRNYEKDRGDAEIPAILNMENKLAEIHLTISTENKLAEFNICTSDFKDGIFESKY